MVAKEWVFLDENIDENVVAAYGELFALPLMVARAMLNRGLTDAGDAKRFLDKDPGSFYSPALLGDMDKAVARIRKALDGREKITVYGDYDVDGITSTALLVKYLRSLGAEADYYIPDRQDEGYGVNMGALQTIAARGTTLLITVDAGITAIEEARWAAENGVDMIITDHHECKDALPGALAVINPKRPDSEYPFKELAGVGVAFKLICALSEENARELLKEYGDLVMLGTIADVVALLDENRAIAAAGLDKLAENPNVGLRAVMKTIGAAQKWNSSAMVSYSIAPRLNAAGRMSNASVAVELLLTNDPIKADELAVRLETENRNRQNEESVIFAQAEKMIAGGGFEDKKVLVLAKEGWHHGIIGVVASRLCDKYNKNCILISIEEGLCKSSGRSVENFNLFEALSECSDILEKFGGHAYAAGFSIKQENIGVLDEKLNRYAMAHASGEVLPKVYIDGRVLIGELTLPAVKKISALAPFGAANKMPTYAVMGVEIADIRPLSSGKHCRLMVEKGENALEVIAFGGGELPRRYFKGDRVDIAGDLNINLYNGRSIVQVVLEDIRFSASEENFLPDRADFVSIYKLLKSKGKSRICGIYELAGEAGVLGNRGMSCEKLLNALDVFQEVGILDFERAEKQRLKITLADTQKGIKVELDKTEAYRRIKAESARLYG